MWIIMRPLSQQWESPACWQPLDSFRHRLLLYSRLRRGSGLWLVRWGPYWPLIGQVILVIMLSTNVVDSWERYLNNFGQSWIILNIHRYQPHKKREEMSRREHFLKRDLKQSAVSLCLLVLWKWYKLYITVITKITKVLPLHLNHKHPLYSLWIQPMNQSEATSMSCG